MAKSVPDSERSYERYLIVRTASQKLCKDVVPHVADFDVTDIETWQTNVILLMLSYLLRYNF